MFSAVMALIVGTAAVLTVLNLAVTARESSRAAQDSALELFGEASARIRANVELFSGTLATQASAAALFLKDNHARGGSRLEFFTGLLDANPDLLSVYSGHADGDFTQVFSVKDRPAVKQIYRTPPETAYIERAIFRRPDGARIQTWTFLGPALERLDSREETDFEYDPRTRPWYKDAQGAKSTVFTAPYVFSSSGLPGITGARPLASGDGVFGADVSLKQLQDMVARQGVTPGGRVFLMDTEGRLVALPRDDVVVPKGQGLALKPASEAADPTVRALARAFEESKEPVSTTCRTFSMDMNGRPGLACIVSLAGPGSPDLVLALAAPEDDFTAHIRRMARQNMLYTLVFLVLAVPVAWLIARRVARPLAQLGREAARVRALDFSPGEPAATRIEEVRQFAQAFEVMRETIRNHTLALHEKQQSLQRLLDAGLALSAEQDMGRLLELIFRTAKDFGHADGGAVYLLDSDGLSVELVSLRDETAMLGKLTTNPASRVAVDPDIVDLLDTDTVLFHACQAFVEGRNAAASGEGFELFPTGLPGEQDGYAIRSLFTVPLTNRLGKAVGVLQLFNPVDPATGEALALHHPGAGFVEALAAQAAVAQDNWNMVHSLRELFESVIRLTAGAIDAKSPYTGGHCVRVPVLAEMLAQAAHEADCGPLADFALEGEEGWREFTVAAWLHDCGKLVIPEYVADKATKLEALHNRIHEVRARFEILWRDACIDALRQLAGPRADDPDFQASLRERLESLREDFAFVAECNIGGEFMSPERVERLRAIASRTWARHFSDRQGLSQAELDRLPESEAPLPVQEPLLSDRPEQRIARTRAQLWPDELPVKMEVPELLYNLGELHNLCVARGTLTPEDRFKINEHIIQTLAILSQIPFPPALKRVPEIAGGHHETLDGRGYPFRLNAEQLSIEARIVAVADIFEALTASDRPYKKAKTLAEALGIMRRMRDDRHIDPDLFEVFLRSGLHVRYAERFLMPWQNVPVDVEALLRQDARGG
ncbi:3'3'-cGAMP-specific phosphodiesterase 1 [Fundidesulfovibrio magnetotacticus]|uniref:3'3'-cGAMP-specific phosphodiesterase 1 n=2 Tax=Fundidesulfovibrio magnetotacticus TaxID=2730080 RepID=A0A6V8LL33_9BACT|nr:3'3'-cGAMP-specific phosphodiesterase 1 [Fundidesulfovibrio magnetotacticus]